MSYRLIDSNNSEFLKDGYITQDTANEMPFIYADLPNGMDGGMYLAIPAHEGMTNGDMLKGMFPNMNVQERNNVTLDIKGQTIEFTGMALKEWWNAPYKGSEG